MTDIEALAYVSIDQTPADLNNLVQIGLWCQKNLAPNSYGFDLRNNTWKFSSQENLTWFLLTWAYNG
jgi:hypothetical protein